MSEGPVGVLCGGPSAEREISIRGGTAVYEALRGRGISARLLILSEDAQKIPDELQKTQMGSAFIVLHGPFGEDGTVQMMLESLRVPFSGSSVETSRYAMDKVSSRRRWMAAHLPVPKWVEADPMNAQIRAETLHFPMMVKPVAQGSSIGMSLVDSAKELPRAIEEAARYGQRILLEEYIKGLELTVGILEDKPLPVVQIVPKRRFYDYVAKYTPHQTEYLVPAPVPEETTRQVQGLAIAAHETLGCNSYSRVDLILSPTRGPVLLEINTIPGMTNTSLLPKAAAAAGISFEELCCRMLSSVVGSYVK